MVMMKEGRRSSKPQHWQIQQVTVFEINQNVAFEFEKLAKFLFYQKGRV